MYCMSVLVLFIAGWSLGLTLTLVVVALLTPVYLLLLVPEPYRTLKRIIQYVFFYYKRH